MSYITAQILKPFHDQLNQIPPQAVDTIELGYSTSFEAALVEWSHSAVELGHCIVFE